MAATQKNTSSRMDFAGRLNMTTPQPKTQEREDPETILVDETMMEQKRRREEEAKKAEAAKKAEEARLAKEAKAREEAQKRAEEEKAKESIYQKRAKKLQEAGKVWKNITLSKELHERAEATAQILGISLNQFINDCIERDLAANQEKYDSVKELRMQLGIKL